MHTSLKIALAAAVVAIAAVVTGPSLRVASAQNETASATAYKIGVVDMDEVLKGYKKLKAEADALQSERDRLQKDLDAKSDALKKKLEEAKNAPEADREARRDSIEKELRDFTADVQRMQGDLDSKGQKLSARTRKEVIAAIQEIGAAENYHLILEGDADGRSTVIYFTNTINITSKVIAKLDGQPAAAAAPKAPAPATGSARKSE